MDTLAGLTVVRTKWTFTLVLDDGLERAVPVAGEHVRLPRPATIAKIIRQAERLWDGVPLPVAAPTPDTRRRAVLRLALGLAPDAPVPVATVRDPRLLRVAMAVVHPRRAHRTAALDGIDGLPLLADPPLTARRLPAVARRLNEPLALVRRVADLYAEEADGQRRWVSSGDAGLAEVFARAALGEGRVAAADLDAARWSRLRHAALDGRHAAEWNTRRGELLLNACPHCGSHRRAPLALRETTEPVCLDCRRDTSGICWPADPYDRWIVRPEIWRAIAPHVLPGPPNGVRRPRAGRRAR